MKKDLLIYFLPAVVVYILLMLCQSKHEEFPVKPGVHLIDTGGVDTTGRPAIPDTIMPEYYVTLPEGKLPWPHHRPDFDEEQFEDMINRLYISKNFGSIDNFEPISLEVLHDIYPINENTRDILSSNYTCMMNGFEIYLDNHTGIYAVDSGYVKWVGDESIIISGAKGESPGYGWQYDYISNCIVKQGKYVKQGEYLGEVNNNLSLRISRVSNITGEWDNFYQMLYHRPDNYFVYNDTRPPVIRKPFVYFSFDEDTVFKRKQNKAYIGKNVDIAVEMKDVGEIGNNLCVTKIEYEINGSDIETYYRKSFDFSEIVLDRRENLDLKTFLIYFGAKEYYLPDPEFYFIIITNTDGTGVFGLLNENDETYCWDTDAVDNFGNPLFPNGTYYITVTAYDFMGNSVSAIDSVFVQN